MNNIKTDAVSSAKLGIIHIKKDKIFDKIVYVIFVICIAVDFFHYFFSLSSLFVGITFSVIAALSIYIYFMDDIYLSINKIIAIFGFLFLYYAPYHQYIDGVTIHYFSAYTDGEYLYANVLIILFLLVYIFFRKVKFKKPLKVNAVKILNPKLKIMLNDITLFILLILSTVCIIYLQLTNQLFSTTESDGGSESLAIVITKIIRFFPVSSLMIVIFAKKNNQIKCKKLNLILYFILNGGIALIIFFPLNGMISRYLLFGTYIMLIICCFDQVKHPSIVLICTVIGFYYIFPAFNFFKYNGIEDLSEFVLGGFDASSSDYDAYQMFLQTIRYVSDNGVTWGSNILAAMFSFIPRSIWQGKATLSGALVSSYYGQSFTNLSCPLVAELYLAFGPIGIIFGMGLFTMLLQLLEKGRQADNYLLKGYYCICVGILLVFLRGSLLPESSFWLCITLSYTVAYVICLFFGKSSQRC